MTTDTGFMLQVATQAELVPFPFYRDELLF